MIPDSERLAADARLRSEVDSHTRAIAARFDRHRSRVVIASDNGLELALPPRMAEGLEQAMAAELSNI